MFLFVLNRNDKKLFGIFYKVYEKYGIETVLKLLQILSGMDKQ